MMVIPPNPNSWSGNPRGEGWSLAQDKSWAKGYIWIAGQGDERKWSMQVREPVGPGHKMLGVVEATRTGLRISSIEGEENRPDAV